MRVPSIKKTSGLINIAQTFGDVSSPRLHHASFDKIRSAFDDYNISQEHAAKTEALKFNVFSVLRMERDEVRLHSALLAHLLNPGGSHGQNTLFLETFWSEIIQQIAPPTVPSPTPAQFIKWRVSAEKFTIHGNLDIVLQSPEHEELWVVENKIDADEGDKQLERYQTWLNSQKRFRTKRLFFLTPDGHLSESLADERAYTCLSYQDHIKRWLSVTIPKICSPKVRAISEQYLEIVQHL